MPADRLVWGSQMMVQPHTIPWISSREPRPPQNLPPGWETVTRLPLTPYCIGSAGNGEASGGWNHHPYYRLRTDAMVDRAGVWSHRGSNPHLEWSSGGLQRYLCWSETFGPPGQPGNAIYPHSNVGERSGLTGCSCGRRSSECNTTSMQTFPPSPAKEIQNLVSPYGILMQTSEFTADQPVEKNANSGMAWFGLAVVLTGMVLLVHVLVKNSGG